MSQLHFAHATHSKGLWEGVVTKNAIGHLWFGSVRQFLEYNTTVSYALH